MIAISFCFKSFREALIQFYVHLDFVLVSNKPATECIVTPFSANITRAAGDGVICMQILVMTAPTVFCSEEKHNNPLLLLPNRRDVVIPAEMWARLSAKRLPTQQNRASVDCTGPSV